MINLFHPLISVAIQISIWALTGNLWYGVAASLFYFGRELAQAEYRWINTYGKGLRANLPFWGQFDPRVWTFKSFTDMILPLWATVFVVLLWNF